MFKHFRPIERNEFFVIGADCSSGGKDRSCAQFISKSQNDVPIVYHSGQTSIAMTNALVPVLEMLFDKTGIKPLIAYERNNGGVFEMERLASMNRSGKYDIFRMPNIGREHNERSVRLGWDTNTSSRAGMLQALKDAVDHEIIRIYDKTTIEEMYSFIVCQTSQTWKAQAERNANDDCVMALAIAYQLYLTSPTIIEKQDRYRRPERQTFDPMAV